MVHVADVAAAAVCCHMSILSTPSGCAASWVPSCKAARADVCQSDVRRALHYMLMLCGLNLLGVYPVASVTAMAEVVHAWVVQTVYVDM